MQEAGAADPREDSSLLRTPTTAKELIMDEARNMALLFFMDHLMQKNGQRTIHDLSCQFGARGFTQEMRDSVGATQEGLTDFLSSFPALFELDGDTVLLKGFGEQDGKNPMLQMPASGRQRDDYEREAVQFFEQKLQKFGPELQVSTITKMIFNQRLITYRLLILHTKFS